MLTGPKSEWFREKWISSESDQSKLSDPSWLELLAKIYTTVESIGGFREVIADKKWDEVVYRVQWPVDFFK